MPTNFYLGQASSKIWACEKMKKFLGQTRISNAYCISLVLFDIGYWLIAHFEGIA